MEEIEGGVSAPEGFLASGIHAGIKKNNKLDLALIYSKRNAIVAGAFTTNRVKAPPVILTRRQVRRKFARAVVINSGNANACTGKQGMIDAEEMVALTANSLSIDKGLVCVASTGVIGELLPMDKIRPAIPVAVNMLSIDGSDDAATAIMTTDTFSKKYAVRERIDGKLVTVGGIAKGAGMICPKMATMLAFITTDVVIETGMLGKVFKKAVDRSFNRITVDGDMSTNDMALCFANGAAGNAVLSGKDMEKFEKMLEQVCSVLAMMIVKDGEGATKLIRITVKGARSMKDAERVAYAVANSSLVKTAFFAGDPNWGRIMAAIGYSGAFVKEDKIGISFEDIPLIKDGVCPDRNLERRVREIMERDEYEITIDLKIGCADFGVLTSDLSTEYVKINANYRS